MVKSQGKRRIGKQSAVGRSFEKKVTVHPVQDELHINTHVRFNEVEGSPVGATYLKKDDFKHRLVFGFRSEGWHPEASFEESLAKVDRLTSAMKELLPNETVTFHFGSFVGDIEIQKELSELGRANDGKEVLQYFVAEEKKLMRRITSRGIRRPKFLYIYVTCTFDLEAKSKEKQDKLETAIGFVYRFFQSQVTNTYFDHLAREVYEFFRTSATDFQPKVQQFLSIKLGIPVTPLSVEELWQINWERFNTSPCPPIPQILNFSSNGLTEEVNTVESVKSYLFDNENSVPVSDYRWLNFKKRYTAILTVQGKAKGWPSAFDQNRTIWDVVSDDDCYDIEVISQISLPDQMEAKENLSKLTKQGLKKAERAGQLGEIDVAANLQIMDAVEAQTQYLRQGVELRFITVILVHRSTKDELDRACNRLEALCIDVGKVRRETVYPWLTLWQTFPTLVWSKLLVFPFDRQLRCSSSEVTGYLPLAVDHSHDKTGFEFITVAGTPLRQDFGNADRIKRFCFIAMPRSGKSVGNCKLVTDLYSRGILCTVIDSPPSDEASTYKDLTEMLGGVYFDVSSADYNILQIPNLNGLPEKIIREKFEEFKSFRLSMLIRMVAGDKSSHSLNPVSIGAIKGVLEKALKSFYDNNLIRKRIKKAMDEGLGSDAWANYPTLRDFIEFCSIQRLNLDDSNPEMIIATRFVATRLNFWCDSRIGSSLSKPSSFEFTNPLFVMIFRAVSDKDEASILGMALNSIVSLRALENDLSLVVIDEFAVLSEYEDIVKEFGDFAANGSKMGLGMVFATQEPQCFLSCDPKVSGQIIGSFDTFAIGRLSRTMIDSVASFLKIDADELQPNVLESYRPNPALGCSYWTIFDGSKRNYARLFVSDAMRAASGNNTSERARRRSLVEKHGGDYLPALMEYVSEIQEAARLGRKT